MKLMVRSWDSTGPSYNAEAEETAILDYSFGHGMDEAAEFQIILSDPTGSIFQKYKGVAAAVYCGPGKATIEDPDGTDVFFGRITKAVPNTSARTLTLFCQDWLSQLDDEQIDYDMREDLDGSGLRESALLPDIDHATYVAPALCTLKYAIAYDGGAFTDETTASRDVDTDDMTLTPAIPVVNDAYYFGFEGKVGGMHVDIAFEGDWVGTMIWEYYDGVFWVEVTNGPAGNKSRFELAVGIYEYTWDIPGDWAETGVDGKVAYYIRARVTNMTAMTDPPGGTSAGGDNYVYDDDMAWDADEWNGMYFILPATMTGRQTITTGPYGHVVVNETDETGGSADVWYDDGNFHLIENDGIGDVTIQYRLRLWMTESTLFTAITGIRGTIRYKLDGEDIAGKSNRLVIASGTGDPGSSIHGPYQVNDDADHIVTFSVPKEQLLDVINPVSESRIIVGMYQGGAETNDVHIYFANLIVDFETIGYSTLVDILDTGANYLRVDKNFHPFQGIDQIGGWTGMNYCISQEIYKHIASDEARGNTLITGEFGGDNMETLTCTATIEHTSGVSTRQYIRKTRLEILNDLRIQDKAHMWIPLGSTTVTWKSTFGAATETLTDTDVSEWSGTLDALAVANKFIVQGIRIGDTQLESTYEDAASINYYNATRTRAVKEPGLVTEYDTLARATALTDQYKDANILLTATIDGNTVKATHDKTIVVGDIIEITSAYLGLTAAVYVVQRQEYDTTNDQTKLTLHPRASTVGMQGLERKNIESIKSAVRRGTVDNYVTGNASDVV